MTSRDYRRLPYRPVVELTEDPDGDAYFLARIAEIPPLRIDGTTREAALLTLDEMFDDFLQGLIDAGDEVPLPAEWAANMRGSELQEDLDLPEPDSRPSPRTVASDSIEHPPVRTAWKLIEPVGETALSTSSSGAAQHLG